MGVLIYFLFFQHYPYGQSFSNFILNITSLDNNIYARREFTYDKNFDNLIGRLLTVDKNYRITWKEYFTHPFFNKK